MKVLILGYSAFAQKTVIPEILVNPDFELAGVASKSRLDAVIRSGLLRSARNDMCAAFNDYPDAIRESGCEVVYISLCNNLHNEWILESLKAGKHVMVDKPGVLNEKEAVECVKSAGEKLLIYESLPFLFHRSHEILKKEKGIIFIDMAFGFPKLPDDNFRNFKKFGGGAVNDLGPYLIATGEYYFGGYPKKIYKVASFNKGAFLFDYGDGKVLSGIIGFGLEYQNKLELWGENYYHKLERAFSFPKAQSGEAFKKMLDDFNKVFRKGDYKKTNEGFFKRARVLGEMNND